MAHGRWRRFIPDRSQLWIPIAIVVLVVATAGFMGLASTRSSAEARYRAAEEKVNQLLEQNERLKGEAAAAGEPDAADEKAHEYFGLVRPGETRIIADAVGPTPVPAPGETGSTGDAAPIWLEWLRRLFNP